MVLILLPPIISNLKWPRIHHGVTFFGLVIGTFSIFNTRAREEAQRRALEQQNRENQERLYSNTQGSYYLIWYPIERDVIS